MTRRYVISDDAVQVGGGQLHRPDCSHIPGGEVALMRAGTQLDITAPPEVEGTDRHAHEELQVCKLCAPGYEEIVPASPTARTAGEIRAYIEGYAAAIIDLEEHGIEAARTRLRFHSESVQQMDHGAGSHPDGE